jgi:replicative DNA helicase
MLNNEQVAVLAVRPAIGKTALALHYAHALSKQSFYIDDASLMSIGRIKSSARRMQIRGLCDLIIIDYLQLAEMKTDNRQYNRQDMGFQASSEAKRMAKVLKVPVILLSQLNWDLEIRPGKHPELADLRDSGAIEQDADVVILNHRPEFYGIH